MSSSLPIITFLQLLNQILKRLYFRWIYHATIELKLCKPKDRVAMQTVMFGGRCKEIQVNPSRVFGVLRVNKWFELLARNLKYC